MTVAQSIGGPLWARQGKMLPATKQANEAHLSRIKFHPEAESRNSLQSNLSAWLLHAYLLSVGSVQRKPAEIVRL